jgi:hypothetical protein
MKLAQLIVVATLTAAASPAVLAQFVKGNEAVRVMPDGSKKVETPPTVGALLAKPCPADGAGCSGGGWKMVETNDGLMECTEVYARATTCRQSTYGTKQLARVWVVKTGTEWKHCSFPDLSKACVSIKSLPSPAVQ